jgi:hypothetical protein
MSHAWKLLTVLPVLSIVALPVLADDLVVPPLSLAAAAAPADPAAPPAGATPGPAAVRAESETGKAPSTQPASPPASQPADPVQAFIAKTKNPFPGFKWGADYRLRNEYLNNVARLNGREAGHEQDWLRHRPRLWTTVSLGDFVDYNMRVIWEGRNIFKPESAQNFDLGEILFDVMNVTLKKPGGLPFTIVGGRQEISLGDKWLVFEGTPGDGSRTIYFDAIRVTTELEKIKTKIDTIYIEQDAEGEHWVKMLKSRDRAVMTGAHTQRYVTEQDERGAIVWVENKSIKDTEIDGYFIYKNDKKAAPNGDDADIYTFGGRAVHDFDAHWKARSEVAKQFGHKNDGHLDALGSLNRLAYYFNDKHNNWLRLDYEYMSGDRPGTGTNEGFDPLWGRWPRFSELLIYTAASETRVSDLSNMHRVAMGWNVNLTPRVEMLTDYHLLFADQNTYRDRPMFTQSGCFRGQLITWWLKYIITPQLSGHVVAEFFFPGDYYANTNNDPATFLRTELVFTY